VEGRDPEGIEDHPADPSGRERQSRIWLIAPLPKQIAPSSCPRPPAQADLQDRRSAARIEDNTYGYCEETGEPISLKRLEARPIATLSVEAQERHEKREKVYRDE
jgi:hypothetical protein